MCDTAWQQIAEYNLVLLGTSLNQTVDMPSSYLQELFNIVHGVARQLVSTTECIPRLMLSSLHSAAQEQVSQQCSAAVSSVSIVTSLSS